MSAEGVTPGLVEVVAPTVDALGRLADSAQEMAGVGLPSTNSTAMTEVAEERSLLTPHLREPIHAAHSESGLLAFAATDHLRNYARLFASQPVPVYSHLVLARACFDACRVAFWVSEPGIGAVRRAQRYLVLRLDNAKQQKRSPIDDVKTKAREIIADVREAASESHWALQAHVNDGDSPRVGDEELPTPKMGIAAVLRELPTDQQRSRLGPVLWWYLSGVTHSVPYSLMQAVEVQATQSPLGPQMGAIFTDARSVILMAWAIATAYCNMTEARRSLFGWESSGWDAAVEEQRVNFAQFKNLL